MHIDRRAHRPHRRNDYRLRVDQSRGREVADVKAAIEAGLAYADGNANIGSECRSGNGGSSYCRG
ncbi:MAG: hypothetical protein ACYC6S_02820, partial [Desulfobulbia bacterium]